jgi:hypothetical protein
MPRSLIVFTLFVCGACCSTVSTSPAWGQSTEIPPSIEFDRAVNRPTLTCELAVIGGGSGGFGAALAAARLGVDVVLIERADCLGGNSVRGGVHCWEMGVGGTGLPFELYRRLNGVPETVGIYRIGRHMSTFNPAVESLPYPGGETVIDGTRRYIDSLQRHIPPDVQDIAAFRRDRWHGVVFEPEAMARAMLAMLEETGRCRVLLNSAFVDVKAGNGRIEQVTLSDGRVLVADYYVDATGDANLCAAVGCETLAGQEAQNRFAEASAPPNPTSHINGVTLLYRVTAKANPAVDPLPDGVPIDCWWNKSFPVAQINHYPNGDLNVNMLPTMEGTEFLQRGYPDAMNECRRRTAAHWHDLQIRFPEFQGYRLSWTAPALGIRETRRVIGEYVLTEHDVRGGLSSQTHADIVCLADHPPDSHGAHARAIGELREPYGVPYRCLIPQGQRNLLVACRAASFSSIAASSCRLSRTMVQLGQAAGTAVALAKELQVDLPEVPPDRLRTALRAQHVQLEYPLTEALRAHLIEE